VTSAPSTPSNAAAAAVASAITSRAETLEAALASARAASAPLPAVLSPEERTRYDRDGVLVLRGWSPSAVVARARECAAQQLAQRHGPMELEADVGYPGAPPSRDTRGGETVRRLLRAWERDEAFRQLGASGALAALLRELLDAPPLLAQAHHNCVMTKMPSFSSLTNWHQDVRYWSYQRPELISAWFALGEETPANGCLSFIPGTQRMNFPRERLDASLFLRTDRDDNRALIDSAITPSLQAGDLVLFHCRVFHAAGRNATDETKFSLVYTYRAADNLPLPGTKSGSVAEVVL
jgi:phytanoyl-CoA hydroxylase